MADKVRDITLPSFSWMEGTLYSGYAVAGISATGAVQVDVCWQPPQIVLYLTYAAFALAALVALLLAASYDRKSSRASRACCAHVRQWWWPARAAVGS